MRRLAALALAALVTAGCVPRHNFVRFNDPLSADEHVQLAMAYEKDGLHDDASAHYEAALAKDEDHVPALVALGNRAYEAGDLKRAGRLFERALEADAKNPFVKNNLAMIYIERGERTKEAERLLADAVDDPAARGYAYDTLATLRIRQGRFDDARQALQLARDHAPDGNPVFLEKLAETAARLEEAEEK